MDGMEAKYPRYINLDGYIFFVGKGLWGSQYMTFKKSGPDALGMHRVISPNLPPRETPQEAQEDLDEYAVARNLAVYDYQEIETGDPEMPEGYLETEDAPTNEEIQESANETDPEDSDEDAASVPEGEPVSLRGDALEVVLDACDQKLTQALRLMFETDQRKFDLNAKITFIRQGGMLKIKYETGFKFDPINYKDKNEIYDDISIALDAGGNPIIPRDREKQLTFDDVEEDTARMTTTVDGQTGLVEHVEVNGEDQAADEEPFPCNNRECPLFGIVEEKCEFDPLMDECDGSSADADVCEAVAVHHCTRPEVIKTYNQYYSPDSGDSEKGDDKT